MDYQSFQRQKERLLSLPLSYRETSLDEIIAIDNTHINVGGAVVELSDDLVRRLDDSLKISRSQAGMAQKTYGNTGVANLRNFFGQAAGKKAENVILVADTSRRFVTDLLQSKGGFIPMQIFFDFAEMFMDSNGYEPEAIEYDESGETVLRMKPLKPVFTDFFPGDSFMSNGLMLRWTPVEMGLDNYFERLVCTNGQIVRSPHKLARIHNADSESLRSLLKLGSGNTFANSNNAVFIDKAGIARRSKASLNELALVSSTMSRLGVDNKDAEEVHHYRQNLKLYQNAGYDVSPKSMRRSVSDLAVWQLFNNITFFATHNAQWDETDLRRSRLMQFAVDFLFRQRDIVAYNNLYANKV